MLSRLNIKFSSLVFVLLTLISFIVLYPSFFLAFSIDEFNNLIYRNNPAFMGVFNPYGFQLWSFNFLYDLLGLNPKPYFIIAFILRVITAFSITFLVYSLSNNKFGSFLSGLIFAVGFTGIQTTSEPVNMNVYLALIFSIFFLYFFFLSRFKFTNKNLFLMTVFLLLTTLASPIRLNPLYIWIFLADLTWLAVFYSKDNLKKFLCRIILTFGLLISLFKLGSFNFGVYGQNTFINTALVSLNKILVSFSQGDFSSVANILVGLGNIVFPNQNNFLANSSPWLFFLIGILYVIFLIIIFLKMLRQKNETLMILFSFLIWAPVFYLLQWIVSLTASSEQVINSFRRYLLPAFVGIAISIGYISTLIVKSKRLNVVNFWILSVSIFIIFHSISTFNFLSTLQSYADGEYVKKIWDQIEIKVPTLPDISDNKISVFYFEVPNKKARYATDNAFSQRAVVLYDIPQNPYELNPNPQVSFSFEELLSYIDGSRLIQLGFKGAKATPVTWERIFAFRVDGDNLVDIKAEIRKRAEQVTDK